MLLKSQRKKKDNAEDDDIEDSWELLAFKLTSIIKEEIVAWGALEDLLNEKHDY